MYVRTYIIVCVCVCVCVFVGVRAGVLLNLNVFQGYTLHSAFTQIPNIGYQQDVFAQY